MKVHLSQIPSEGLHLEGEEDRDILELPPTDPVQPVGRVRYALDIGINADGMWATGEAGLDVRCQCVRCLEPFTRPVVVEDFAVQVERPATETVDLTPQVREDILLALPAYPRCDWSGEKVCPREFPVVAEVPAEAGLAEANADGVAPANAWEALDRLEIPDNKHGP